MLTSPIASRSPLKNTRRCPSKIPFKSNGVLTLGAELELQIIDPETYNLKAIAPEILKLNVDNLKQEFYLSTIEIITNKCRNVTEIGKDLERTFEILSVYSEKNEVLFASTGTHAFSKFEDWQISPGLRYEQLIKKGKWLCQRMCTFGTHIHIGMESASECISYQHFFTYFLPHLLALSASSPYWQNIDTGLSSTRPSIYESLPTAGQPSPLETWAEFEHVCHSLFSSQSITSLKDLWWDIRPSPAFGTLEIRVCDSIASLSEVLAIIAFIHCLAHWYKDNRNHQTRMANWVSCENKWRVMSNGLDCDIINIDGNTKPLKDDLLEWCDRLKPYFKQLNYHQYLEQFYQILQFGNSSTRQKKVYQKTGSFEQVVKHNVEEFKIQKPFLRI